MTKLLPEDGFAGFTKESLQEAVLMNNRLRLKEKQSRLAAESLLHGLDVLLGSSTPRELREGMVKVLRDGVPFEAAAIISQGSDGLLGTDVTTSRNLVLRRVPVGPIFSRAFDGASALVADLMDVEEWPASAGGPDNYWRSALIVPMDWGDQHAALVTVHSQRARFSRSHLRFAETFAPMASKAMAQAEDMLRLESLVEELDHRAHHDDLTGLANRSLFNSVLNAYCERENAPAVGVVMIDVDHFKLVNDTLGHAFGDRLLCEVAARLRTVVGQDGCVARLGGDEFAIVLSDVGDEEVLRRWCDKMAAELKVTIELEGKSIEPVVSVGALVAVASESEPEKLLRNADLALYEAKDRGRDQVCMFKPSMRHRRDQERQLSAAIRYGLDNNEFSLHYQPLIDLPGGECVGVEALARWTTSGGETITPDVFIPVAESSGLILPLGDWVIRTALSQTAVWLQAVPGERRVAINVAEQQLHDYRFAERLERLASEHGVLPGWIELELNERMVASTESQTVQSNLSRLANAGFQIAFDDFGTGNSSIKHLQLFPGQRVKIDRSFVSGMLHQSADLAIVRGVIDLAHSLGMTVVAEGVENPEETAYLIDLGCDEVQGFLFGRPASFAELDDTRRRLVDGECRLPAVPESNTSDSATTAVQRTLVVAG